MQLKTPRKVAVNVYENSFCSALPEAIQIFKYEINTHKSFWPGRLENDDT